MTPVTAITILMAALCGLSRRFAASLVGAFLLMALYGARLMERQPASVHHILVHGFHLLLVFNATYAAFLLVAATVL